MIYCWVYFDSYEPGDSNSSVTNHNDMIDQNNSETLSNIGNHTGNAERLNPLSPAAQSDNQN